MPPAMPVSMTATPTPAPLTRLPVQASFAPAVVG
jgi:hypothetical protein